MMKILPWILSGSDCISNAASPGKYTAPQARSPLQPSPLAYAHLPTKNRGCPPGAASWNNQSKISP